MKILALSLFCATFAFAGKAKQKTDLFQTSDRCIACHINLITPSGQDVSIGTDWQSSLMANSSRDPYWQASVRREAIDHRESSKLIEEECSSCHLPIIHYEAKQNGVQPEVFKHLPIDSDENKKAADGVTCSVCHQISKRRLGTRESFNGEFLIDKPENPSVRPEYGPFDIDKGHQRIMQTSSGGYQPNDVKHIQQSELCATCHTLYTKALGEGGKVVGELPEQMPYQEWLHSEYRDKQSCQACHMPVVAEPVRITQVLGAPRENMARHIFVGANFFMQRMLDRYREELDVVAKPEALTAAANRTVEYLKTKAATLTLANVEVRAGRLHADVTVDNLGGHKLPTAYPARRAWLHFTVRDSDNRIVFESGAVQPNGSIAGNDNDDDPNRFEPHYREITRPDQVQIYEAILRNEKGAVTTSLLSAVSYLKDNRLLPHGFDKATASKDVAVHGDAAEDAGFTAAGHRLHYAVPIANAQGPFRVEAELWYEPIGFRWATNLKGYEAAEPQRFTRYFDSMASGAAVLLVRATQ